jgi:hypothetical protein
LVPRRLFRQALAANRRFRSLGVRLQEQGSGGQKLVIFIFLITLLKQHTSEGIYIILDTESRKSQLVLALPDNIQGRFRQTEDR